MKLRQPGKKILDRIRKWHLEKKWQKALALISSNFKHPSLHTELMEPRHHGIYSFRLDKKYRALFFIYGGEIEIFQVTKHYKK